MESSGPSFLVQGVNVRNNPFVLLTVLIMSAILIYGESKNPTKIITVKKVEEALVLESLISRSSFNAHDLDKTARSIHLKSTSETALKCSFTGGLKFNECSNSKKISWSAEDYHKGFKFVVKDELGNIKSFSPKAHNPFLSFHKCDVLFKKGGTEKSFRSTLRNIQDLNQDQMKVLCLDEGLEIVVKNGPLVITTDLLIIGTHSNTAKFIGRDGLEVFHNDSSSLFLYNLSIETSEEESTAISLGVGSYLGADNLKIKTASANSKGINCFGCTIDGEGLEVLSTSVFTTAIESTLGLIELRRSTLQGASRLLSFMRSNINLIDENLLAANSKLREN
jgi:hypothetical protein